MESWLFGTSAASQVAVQQQQQNYRQPQREQHRQCETGNQRRPSRHAPTRTNTSSDTHVWSSSHAANKFSSMSQTPRHRASSFTGCAYHEIPVARQNRTVAHNPHRHERQQEPCADVCQQRGRQAEGSSHQSKGSRARSEEPGNRASRRRSGSFGSSMKAALQDFFSPKNRHTSKASPPQHQRGVQGIPQPKRQHRQSHHQSKPQRQHSQPTSGPQTEWQQPNRKNQQNIQQESLNFPTSALPTNSKLPHTRDDGYRPRSHSTCTASPATSPAEDGGSTGEGRKGRSGSFGSGPTRWLRTLLNGIRSRSRSNSMLGTGSWDDSTSGRATTTGAALATSAPTTIHRSALNSSSVSHSSAQGGAGVSTSRAQYREQGTGITPRASPASLRPDAVVSDQAQCLTILPGAQHCTGGEESTVCNDETRSNASSVNDPRVQKRSRNIVDERSQCPTSCAPCLVLTIGTAVARNDSVILSHTTHSSPSVKHCLPDTVKWAGADTWLWEQSRPSRRKRVQYSAASLHATSSTVPRSSVRMSATGATSRASVAVRAGPTTPQSTTVKASTTTYTHTATTLTAARINIRGAENGQPGLRGANKPEHEDGRAHAQQSGCGIARGVSTPSTVHAAAARDAAPPTQTPPRARVSTSCTPSPPVHVRHQPSNIVYRWQLGVGCGARMEARRKELLTMDLENSPALVAEWMALLAMRAHVGAR